MKTKRENKLQDTSIKDVKNFNDEDYNSSQYRQILRISQMTIENELRREDSLLTQASHMQTAFAFTTAAIFTILPVCLENKGKLSYLFFYIWIAIIIFFMLASLVCASAAQWRFKTLTYESVENIKGAILNDSQWKKYTNESYCDAQVVDMFQKIYSEKYKINEKRVMFIMTSMVCFFTALSFVIICFICATYILWIK